MDAADVFATSANDYSEMLQDLQQHAKTLRIIKPTEVSISTMTLGCKVDVKPNLRAIESAVSRRYNTSAVLPRYGHWRGHNFSMPKKYQNVFVTGCKFGGGTCICLDVGTRTGSSTGQGQSDQQQQTVLPWAEPVCHAKVFKTGNIKLGGCTTYGMANAAIQKLVTIKADTHGTPVQVTKSKTCLINGVFAMPPFCKEEQIMDKEQLNDLARDAGFHVHSGASDGKPYIKFVLERNIKALVYVSGKVWVTGCRSMQDLGGAARRVQSFIDTHAEMLLAEGSD